MLFKDLKGIEGIDKLNECIPYVEEIIGDTALFEDCSKKEMSWLQAATPVYKKHRDSITKLMEILDEKPESAMDIIATTARIIAGIMADEETKSFFILSSTSLRSAMRAMVTTEGEQSKDS